MKIKEIHGNEISPVLSFPSHERAKLVLFYNPSAAATRRGGPRSRSFIGSARSKREREIEREMRGEKGRRRNPSGRLDERLRRGWNGCQLVF